MSELTFDQHKLEAEYEMQKKSCHCSPKSSPEKRSSSTVIQINDLKTKLMNKSMEQSKATEALKRKTQQLEKLQKTAFEEKTRLREECLKSIQTTGELKSKISLLELRVQEQNDEVVTSREKVKHALAKMSLMETELASKNAKFEDLEAREEKWVWTINRLPFKFQSLIVSDGEHMLMKSPMRSRIERKMHLNANKNLSRNWTQSQMPWKIKPELFYNMKIAFITLKVRMKR